MAFLTLGKKAQASVEFLFLFVMMLMYVNTIVYPSMETSQKYLKESNRMAVGRLAAKQIANAVSEVASSTGDSQQVFYIFLDDDVNILCNDTGTYPTIDFHVAVEFSTTEELPSSVQESGIVVGECPSLNMCIGREIIYLPSGITLNCFAAEIDGSATKKAKIVVRKVGGLVSVTWTGVT